MTWHDNIYRKHLKPAFDRLGAATALLLCAPLLLIVAITVRVKIGAPVLFTQIRPGKDGQPFRLYKFRTMTDAHGRDDEVLADEQRLTPFGRWLRSTSLDELPELWNVLRGEMSFVGPRPLLTQYLSLYTPRQSRRHEVKPGLTGLAQVNGRNQLPWVSRFALDTWYVDHVGLLLDLGIMARTVHQVFTRQGINSEGHATAPTFRGTGGRSAVVQGRAPATESALASLRAAEVDWTSMECYNSPPHFANPAQEPSSMNARDFLALLDEVFQVTAGTTQMGDQLKDISEYSSLMVLVLIAAIDEKIGVTVAPEELAACRTVADLAALAGFEKAQLQEAA